VPLPAAPPAGRLLHLERGPGGAGWKAWSGWAAAGLLAVCWLGSAGWTSPSRAPQKPNPGPAFPAPVSVVARDDAGADDRDTRPSALREPRLRPDAADDQSHVLGELPLKLVSTRRADDGRPGYEVVVLRRVLERTRVDNMLSLGADDAGRPAPVFVDPALIAQADSY